VEEVEKGQAHLGYDRGATLAMPQVTRGNPVHPLARVTRTQLEAVLSPWAATPVGTVGYPSQIPGAGNDLLRTQS
jgi:hypothetical protein